MLQWFSWLRGLIGCRILSPTMVLEIRIYSNVFLILFHRTSILLRCVSDVSLLFSNNSTGVSAQVAVVKYILINAQILISLSTNLELTLLHFVISGSRSFWWFSTHLWWSWYRCMLFFDLFLSCSHGLQPILWFMKFIEVNCCNLMISQPSFCIVELFCYQQILSQLFLN